MKLLFLGTGAADWKEDVVNREQFFRKHASALVDEVLLIDPGPSVIAAINEYSLDVKKIKYVLNTHRHWDHFNTDTLDFLKETELSLSMSTRKRNFNWDAIKFRLFADITVFPPCII